MNIDPFNLKATPRRLLVLLDKKILSPEAWERASTLAGHTPTLKSWSRSLDWLLLLLGSSFLIVGTLIFMGQHWDDMGRLLKFAALEIGLVALVAFVTHEGFRVLTGKVALLAASILVGILLGGAVATYEVEIDPTVFLLVWISLITSWVVIGQWEPLWLFWLALINLTALTYWNDIAGTLVCLVLNTMALTIWEVGDWQEIHWMASRWVPRVVAAVIISMSVWLMALFIFADSYELTHHRDLYFALPLYLVLTPSFLVAYIHLKHDLFMLGLCGTGFLVVAASFFLNRLIESDADEGSFVFATFALGTFFLGATAAMVRSLLNLHRKWESVS
jgi:uncharacterized membrane protein